MKKIFKLIKAAILLSTFSFLLSITNAQIPQAFNYQAIARDASGNIMSNQTIGIKIVIHQTSSSGSTVYSETFSPTTNQFGLFTIAIGQGTPLGLLFNTINWSSGNYWLQVLMSPTNNSVYTDMGSSQLLSVPYAMYAANAGVSGITGATGANGATGVTGATGAAGTTGTTGITGTTGADGSLNAWGITGSTGIVDGTNFIGTLNKAPLNFEVNSQKAGRIDTTGSTFLGYEAAKNTTGTRNSAYGYQALYNNTTGIRNNAFGYQALYSNVNGNYNTAVGNGVLYTNTKGSNNTANGWNALYFNTSGINNTATGVQALYSDTSGSKNNAYGFQSLYSNTNGSYNTAFGNSALYSNTTGFSNAASGFQSLYSNISGVGNTANGDSSLYHNTTGSFNTAIGYKADISSGTLTNSTAIGSGATATASNQVVLGNTSVTTTEFSGALMPYYGGAYNAGTSGQVLTSQGTSVAPQWETPSNVHTIGESYGGGIVFYVYDNGLHGLIAATADQSTGMRWYAGTNTNTMAMADGVGAGKANTAIIIASQGYGDGATYAARVCNEYSVTVNGVTYGDWYLPSKYELSLLYYKQSIVGGFPFNEDYWSSTECDSGNAWLQNFYVGGGGWACNLKSLTSNMYVRAIRAF